MIPKIIFKYNVISRLALVANEVENQNTDSIEKKDNALLGPEPAKCGQLEQYTHKSEAERTDAS
jgi:hypothetical protein